MAKEFTCQTCGASFSVPEGALQKYPGWTPKVCRRCKPPKKAAATRRERSRGPKSGGRGDSGPLLTLAEVLERYEGGPQEGLFTDGGCSPNPGPGGWGVVWVDGGKIKDQRHGHEKDTTNNRMELRALIEALSMIGPEDALDVYSDSDLCVKTLTQWAKGWEKNGWKRKTGPIKNLDLVKEAYALVKQRPKARIKWLRAHNGSLWNEYADSLANAYRRADL